MVDTEPEVLADRALDPAKKGIGAGRGAGAAGAKVAGFAVEGLDGRRQAGLADLVPQDQALRKVPAGRIEDHQAAATDAVRR
jgi:hypothetical protein